MKELQLDKSAWKPVRFGDVVFEPKESVKDARAEGIQHVVGLEHIESEDIHLRRSNGIDESTTFSKKFSQGDVLFGRRRAYLKKAAQATFEGICSGDITVMRAKENLLPELLPFIVNNDKFFDWAITHSAGGLSPRVKFKDLANYEFLLPPKEQQAQIAELLWAMDEVVEKNNVNVNGLGIYFQSWLNDRINSKKGWPTHSLSKVAKVQTGIAKNFGLADHEDVIELPYIRVANVQDGYLKLDEIKSIHVKRKDIERFSLKSGDLLLTEGGDFDKLGRGYVWQGEIEQCLHQNHVFAVRPNLKLITSWFLSLITRSAYGKQYFLQCAKKTSNLASINSSQLKEFRVFTPSLEEQFLIEEEMKSFFDSSLKAVNVLSASKALQKSLINQVF